MADGLGPDPDCCHNTGEDDHDALRSSQLSIVIYYEALPSQDLKKLVIPLIVLAKSIVEIV